MKTQTKLICVGAVLMTLLSMIIVMAVFEDTEGPLIYEVDVLPLEPAEGDMINVIIYCIDQSGVSGAELHSTVNGTNWDVQPMHFYACLCIAGGRWVAVFGPVSEGSSARFYVTAFDNSPTRNAASTDTFTLQVSA